MASNKIACALALLSFAVAASAQLEGSAWPKFRGDARNEGRSLSQGVNGILKWSTSAPNSTVSSPAIGNDGTVYIGSGLNVLALNGATGAIKWSTPTEGVVFASPAIGADGTVFVGSSDKNFYALDGKTGAVKWSFATAGLIYGSASMVDDHTVYVGTYDSASTGHFYAFDQRKGTMIWSVSGPAIVSSPAIGFDGTIYVGALDHNVYALSPILGVTLWKFATNGNVESAPAIGHDNTVFVNADDGNLYAIDAFKGTEKWAFNTNHEISFAPSIVSSPAVGPDGTVYFGSSSMVYALDGFKGTLLWNYTTGATVQSSPAVDGGGNVFIGPDDGNVYALNGKTGAVEWSLAVSGQRQFGLPYGSASSPAIGYDGSLYVGDGPGVAAIESVGTLSLTVSPAALVGGGSATGTISLTNPAPAGGAAVSLFCDRKGITLPSTVDIAAGQTSATFTIGTSASNQPEQVGIAAATLGRIAVAQLTVVPVLLSSLTLDPTSVSGGTTSTGTVTLSGPAPKNITIQLHADDPARTPDHVTIPAGSTSATFTVTTKKVKTAKTVTVVADFYGDTVSASLSITP